MNRPALDPRANTSPLQRLQHTVGAVIRGKPQIVDQAIITLMAEGHLLLEDVPGVGKSSLAIALAHAVGGSFRRIQFTSDLLPADLTGINVWLGQREHFEFHEGPLFANFVLADEINRAPPRTQSALLEAMGEHQVTVDGASRMLPTPFMVIATQNPVEHHGTYPLPESQRDRFLLRASLGYASADVETALLQQGPAAPSAVQPVIELSELIAVQRMVRSVFVHADLAAYAQRVVQATREHASIRLGVSTRGALAWIAAARARATLHGRTHVVLDDLQELAVFALAHRIVLAQVATGTETDLVAELLRDLMAGIAAPL